MGEPRGASRPDLVLATYNVHGCAGGDGRCDPERVAAVIAEVGPDAIALQEVDSRRHPGGGGGQLDLLARVTGLHAVAGSTIRDQTGEFGNALLTRLPVVAVRRVELGVPAREPRGLLDATLAWGGGTLRVCATHLGLGRSERWLQIARILEVLETAGEDAVAVVGDFNRWWGHELTPLHRLLGRPPAPATFPSRRAVAALDRIWFRPRAALDEVRAHRSAASRVASDHLPLVARVRGDGIRDPGS